MEKVKQLTAVQFIKEQIELHSDTSFFNIDWDKFDEIFEAAKTMEKEQIMNAYKHELDNSLGTKILAEQYYNETYSSGRTEPIKSE